MMLFSHGCFYWKIGAFQQTVVKVYYILKNRSGGVRGGGGLLNRQNLLNVAKVIEMLCDSFIFCINNYFCFGCIKAYTVCS